MSDDLKHKLDSWKITPEVPGDFQREVWQRIAARDTARRQSGWRLAAQRFFELLATPRYATFACLTAILIGAGAAHFQSNQENHRRWSELRTRYTTSIDPAARAFLQ